MNRISRAASALLRLSLLALVTGCAGLLKPPPFEVSIDAISGPQGVGGTSYQLIARDALAPRDPVLHAEAMASVTAALADKGMFEAPPGARPDLYVTVDYGLGNTLPVMSGPAMVEKFLLMSARKEQVDPKAGTRSEELWNVRALVSVPGTNLDAPLPLLALVAADYIGLDTVSEKPIKIPRDSPALTRIFSIVNQPAAKIAP